MHLIAPVISAQNFKFIRSEHLHLKREAEKVFELGNRAASAHFVLRWCEQSKTVLEISGGNVPSRRISVRISRAFGSAPRRNRAKRIVREIFRQEKSRFIEKIDIIVNIKPLSDPEQLHMNYLKPQFLKACADAGILTEEKSSQENGKSNG